MPSRILLIGGQDYYAAGSRHIGPWRLTIDTGVTTDFSLRTNSTCNVDIDWGDGVGITTDISGVGALTTHNYSAPGTYTVEITLNSGDFWPYYNFDAAAAEIVTLGDTPDGWSFGNRLDRSFPEASNLTTVGNIDTSAVYNFELAWYNCTSLESFSLIDTSGATIFRSAWNGCSSLTSFPLIDTSLGTNFFSTWYNCSSLTSFPPIDTSLGTEFRSTWEGCAGLTSFPPIDTSLGTTFFNCWYNCTGLTSFPALPAGKRPVPASLFYQAWRNCSNMTDFPANFFDDWTGTPANNCFTDAWRGCTSLTAASVENILNSIDTSGRSAPVSLPDIRIDYDVATGVPNIATAVTNLKARNWTITLNGVAQ